MKPIFDSLTQSEMKSPEENVYQVKQTKSEIVRDYYKSQGFCLKPYQLKSTTPKSLPLLVLGLFVFFGGKTLFYLFLFNVRPMYIF